MISPLNCLEFGFEQVASWTPQSILVLKLFATDVGAVMRLVNRQAMTKLFDRNKPTIINRQTVRKNLRFIHVDIKTCLACKRSMIALFTTKGFSVEVVSALIALEREN